jgi:hypothetical protein
MQVRNTQRVRELGEVFTHEREVNAMLDLVADEFVKPDATFLEPSCGNGNFLIAILHRKLEALIAFKTTKKKVEFQSFVALSSIYGIDICDGNVIEARERLYQYFSQFYTNYMGKAMPYKLDACIHYVLNHNIQAGDTLNGTQNIYITEYTWNDKAKTVTQKRFCFEDLIPKQGLFGLLEPHPVSEVSELPYLELGTLLQYNQIKPINEYPLQELCHV